MVDEVKQVVRFKSHEFVQLRKAAEKVGMSMNLFIRTNVGLAVDEVLSDCVAVVPADDSEVASGEEAYHD